MALPQQHDASAYNRDYQIFISYRREGGETLAAFIYERLVQRGYKVFYDIESLRSGDFNEKLLEVIERCEDVLAVLPPGGLDRCSNPGDWVYRELAHAFKIGKNVIPIRMRNFKMPKSDELPPGIAELPRRNGVSANMEYFDAVMNKICSTMLTCSPSVFPAEDHARALRRRRTEEALGPDEGRSPLTLEEKNELGLILEYGLYSEEQNLREALALYREAYEHRGACFPHAGYNLADVYERCASDLSLLSEYGIDVDAETDGAPLDDSQLADWLRKKARQYYRGLADNGYPPACYRLGNILEDEGQLEEARILYEAAAGNDYPPAINALGWMYSTGSGGVEISRAEAKRLYRRAAKLDGAADGELSYAPALYNLATLMEEDDEDPEEVLRLLKRVAFGGEGVCEGGEAVPLATYALGRLYEKGISSESESGQVFHDYRNAVTCYERAYMLGVEEAGESLRRCRESRNFEEV